MATRKVRRKAEGRNIIVNVKIGDTKPKRRRRAARKPRATGGTGISPIGRTEVTYTPALVTPSPAAVLPEVDPFRRMAASNLLEDVKRERIGLLKDIERQTESQINKRIAQSQGAEQRGELAQIGFFDPNDPKQYAQPFGDVATGKQAPSLTAMMKPSRPKIDEIDELPYKDYPEEPAMQAAEQKKKKLKIVKKLDRNDEPPQPIKEKPIEQNIKEAQPEETVKKAVDRLANRDEFYEKELKPLGLPRVRGDIPQWRDQIYDLYVIAKQTGKVKRGSVNRELIDKYYGSNIFKGRTGIPMRVMEEEQNLSEYTKESFNLKKQT